MNRKLLKLATSASAIALTSLLSTTSIFAAEYIEIDDFEGDYDSYSDYDSTGKSWQWTDKDNLSLNNYDGSMIGAVGNLNIHVSGNNNVSGSDYGIVSNNNEDDYPDVTESNIVIDGDGTLNIEAGIGIYASDGDVTIEDTTVNIEASEAAIAAYGDINLKNASVKGESYYYGLYAYNDINIENSDVDITSEMPAVMVVNGTITLTSENEDDLAKYTVGTYTFGGESDKTSKALLDAKTGEAAMSVTIARAVADSNTDKKTDKKEDTNTSSDKGSKEVGLISKNASNVDTGVFTNAGYMFGTTASVSGAGILAMLKKMKKK